LDASNVRGNVSDFSFVNSIIDTNAKEDGSVGAGFGVVEILLEG